eukprot:TRINITY_DN30727_c1_g1_i1.p1 TRINITY_DN30727_c1_g1~~TRINITY_DN30727_c1_g1_i1.p1  ORF type:complete len:560 (+),score=141.85 TRINITY_DN30727_c1_g1_i1:77-1756(+)
MPPKAGAKAKAKAKAKGAPKRTASPKRAASPKASPKAGAKAKAKAGPKAKAKAKAKAESKGGIKEFIDRGFSEAETQTLEPVRDFLEGAKEKAVYGDDNRDESDALKAWREVIPGAASRRSLSQGLLVTSDGTDAVESPQSGAPQSARGERRGSLASSDSSVPSVILDNKAHMPVAKLWGPLRLPARSVTMKNNGLYYHRGPCCLVSSGEEPSEKAKKGANNAAHYQYVANDAEQRYADAIQDSRSWCRSMSSTALPSGTSTPRQAWASPLPSARSAVSLHAGSSAFFDLDPEGDALRPVGKSKRKPVGVSRKYGQSTATQITDCMEKSPDKSLLYLHEEKVNGLFAGCAGRGTWEVCSRNPGKAEPAGELMSPPPGTAGSTSHRMAVQRQKDGALAAPDKGLPESGLEFIRTERYRNMFKGLAGKEGWASEQQRTKRLFPSHPAPKDIDLAVEQEQRPKQNYTKRTFHNASRNQMYVTEQFDIHGPSSWRVFDKDQLSYFEESAGRATWERRWDRGKRGFQETKTVVKTTNKKSFGNRKFFSEGVRSCIQGNSSAGPH